MAFFDLNTSMIPGERFLERALEEERVIIGTTMRCTRVISSGNGNDGRVDANE